ncbi:DEAD/DEAH box helicase [Pseudomonas sp. MLB6B]
MADAKISMQALITTAQGPLLEPEAFQSTLINNMTRTLLHSNRAPCLLRAPTGSGKTFMLARVLADVSAAVPTVWFWFVPFVTLVAQTLDALKSNASDLTPTTLTIGRNQQPDAGLVMIATTQAVAKSQWRVKGYDAGGDDDTRTIAEWVTLARERSYSIGMVVDEAHIALDKATEFGKFAQWLNPDFLLMATATPKDQRILDFLDSAGKSNFETFAVSRDDVVDARLNKRYIEAVIYDLAQSVQSVADLKRTVLRQAWKRNLQLKQRLADAGIPLVPLLLVQVANGNKTVEEAEQDLIRLCKVPPGAIGKHSSDDPDPVLMAAIANDSSKEVLIFKQSAGTGFDAPRAFILASTKLVSDPDFAMQFIGRVMRVSLAMRNAYPDKAIAIPEIFDTAYVYLADATAQKGFEKAVYAASLVKSQLQGQTEKLQQRRTVGGAIVLTNKQTSQFPLTYNSQASLKTESIDPGQTQPRSVPVNIGPQADMFSAKEAGDFDDWQSGLSLTDTPALVTSKIQPQTYAELMRRLAQGEIRIYPRRSDLINLPVALPAERKPQFTDMSLLSRGVAARLEISSLLADNAIRVARNQLKDTERRTELISGDFQDEKVLIVTDRTALSKEARAILSKLPQVEEEDIREILTVLAARLLPILRSKFEDFDPEKIPDDIILQRMARDAANWVAKQQADKLEEGLYAEIALQAESFIADSLPDAMVFAVALPLSKSSRNIYGVFPPTQDEVPQIAQHIFADDRYLLKDRLWSFESGNFKIGQYDSTVALNKEEMNFARALDRSDFVSWWHRNPDRKSYSVKLVRGEHKNNFYPDFVVCLSHYPGDVPILRLVETKQDSKDAARKAKHVPAFYGKVLFLTKDQNRLKWVKEDGSLGNDVDLEDLVSLREWMRASRPEQKALT